MSDFDLREELRAHPEVKNTYCVNQKMPPTYERKWKLNIMWTDGDVSTILGRDERGSEDVYRQGLRSADAKMLRHRGEGR